MCVKMLFSYLHYLISSSLNHGYNILRTLNDLDLTEQYIYH